MPQNSSFIDNVYRIPPCPDMSRDEYIDTIRVHIVPEEDAPAPPSGDARFWLSTRGLTQHGLPEMEIVDVGALYIEAAGDILNRWAYYALHNCPITAGETLDYSENVLPTLLRAIKSPNQFWKERGVECLRVVVDHVEFHCFHCGGDGCDCPTESDGCPEPDGVA